MLFGRDPPGPVSTVVPAPPLDKLGGQGEVLIADLLDAEAEAVVHQPAVALQVVPLLTSVPQVDVHAGELPHPHQACRERYDISLWCLGMGKYIGRYVSRP